MISDSAGYRRHFLLGPFRFDVPFRHSNGLHFHIVNLAVFVAKQALIAFVSVKAEFKITDAVEFRCQGA